MYAKRNNSKRSAGGMRMAAAAAGCMLAVSWAASARADEAGIALQRRVSSARGIKMESGRTEKAYAGSAKEAALSFIADRKASVARRAGGEATFSATREMELPTGTLVEVEQTEQGLPVFNSRVRLVVAPTGQVTHVTDETSEFPALATTQPAKSLETLRSAIELADPSIKVGTAGVLGVWVDRGAGRLAFRVSATIREASGRNVPYELIVIADSSEIVERTRLLAEESTAASASETASSRSFTVCAQSGTTAVFDPNPVTMLGGMPSGSFPAQVFRSVDLRSLLLAPSGGRYSLSSRNCVIEDIESPTNAVPSSSSPEFGYGPNDECFSAVMCFYHINKEINYVRSLGFTGVFPQAIRCDHLGANLETNAYYMPRPSGAGYVAFGLGMNGRPIAEDADVIYHETGHALQDNVNPGAFGKITGLNGFEARSIGEGFGDYMTFSMTFDANMNGPMHDPDSLAEWAWNGQPLRRSDGTKHYPQDLRGEEHADGEMWAAATVQIFRAIGKTASDKIVIYANALMPSSGPTFEDAALAVLAADHEIFNDAHREVITQIFVARGFLEGGSTPTDPDPTDPSQDDSFEDNDTSDAAKPITNGTYQLQCRDQDWYLLTVGASADVNLSIAGQGGDLDLYLLDMSGNEIGRSAGESSNEGLSGALEAGRYYLLVDPYQGHGAAYSMSISVGGTAPQPNPNPDPPCIPAGGCGAGAPSCLLAMAAGLMGARPAIRRRARGRG